MLHQPHRPVHGCRHVDPAEVHVHVPCNVQRGLPCSGGQYALVDPQDQVELWAVLRALQVRGQQARIHKHLGYVPGLSSCR